MKYSVDIPVQPGDSLLVYENLIYGNGWQLGEPVLYEVTNLTITQNKKKQWTKKIRAMRVINNKTVDIGITLDFADIGVKAFLQEQSHE
jgi:membrane-bound lytic murein transglycosylase B